MKFGKVQYYLRFSFFFRKNRKTLRIKRKCCHTSIERCCFQKWKCKLSNTMFSCFLWSSWIFIVNFMRNIWFHVILLFFDPEVLYEIQVAGCNENTVPYIFSTRSKLLTLRETDYSLHTAASIKIFTFANIRSRQPTSIKQDVSLFR